MTPGAFLLAAMVRQSGLDQATFAKRELGWHKTTLGKILKGQRLPGRKNATQLWHMYGIPMDAWEPTVVGKRRKPAFRKAGLRPDRQAANA